MSSHATGIIAAILLLTATLAAQIGVEVRTVTPMTVSTTGGAPSIPANTVLASGQGVTSTGGTTCQETATTNVTFSSTPTTADVLFRSNAHSGSIFGQCTASSAFAGENTLRVSLTSPVPVSGRVIVSVVGIGNTSLNSSDATYAIDVGDDGSTESAARAYTVPGNALAAFVERPIVLGPTPLPILLQASATAYPPYFGSTHGYADITVTFRSASGRLDLVGAQCGPTLNGTLVGDHDGHRLLLHATSTLAAPWAFLAIGTQDLAFALPPTQCLLRTDPSALAPIGFAGSAWSLRVTLPTPLTPLDLRAQVVAATLMPELHWHTSEGLRVRLP
jgi:hypothetical protein